jgi:2-iminobutanoate/2-iminopropanoate deaminase
MAFEVIATPGLPPAGQFSHVVRKGKFVFISGQTAKPEAEEGNIDPRAQADRVFSYLREAITAAGGKMDDIVKINVFLTDRDQFPSILELRPLYFKPPYPAASTVIVSGMPNPSIILEIEAIAILD